MELSDMASLTKDQIESPVRQFCTFMVHNRLFGVDILHVKEVNTHVQCAPIYHAPPEIKGYINIRGQIYLILDSQVILGFDATAAPEKPEHQRIILFKSSIDESFGVLVDRISDVVTISTDKIENRRTEGARQERSSSNRMEPGASNLSEGIAKLDDQLLVIIDPQALLRIGTTPLSPGKSQFGK